MDQNGLARGVQLFNRGDFFGAHEQWEDVWREMHGVERRRVQGLIQLAVAFHHHSTGNLAGARSLLERGMRRLLDAGDGFQGISMAPLRASLQQWEAALAAGTKPPPYPRLQRNRVVDS